MPASAASRRPAWLKPLGFAFVVATAIAAGWGGWAWYTRGSATPAWRFAKVERGSIAQVVSASGTLQAVTTVQVGSTISGQIKEILVDFNSAVRKGQLLARIDPQTYELRVRQAEADLEAARTAYLQRQSDAMAMRSQAARARIAAEDARTDLERKESLVGKGFISPAERDKARFTAQGADEAVRTADAQARSADAQVANAAATVKQREAALASARNDLDKTEITAPVDGVVISRQVDAGQTVAASLNTPTLFTIAQDLRKMQVAVAIDETDIGKIRPDQRATFGVDAYPGGVFEGRIDQIRKAATTVQNVVTYTVIVATPNPDLRLVPGMTANVRIVTDSRENVLKVANAALRWRPAGASFSDAASAAAAVGAGGDLQARRRKLVDELKLDAAQAARVEEIYAESRGRLAELRDLNDADRRQRGERIRAEVRQKISAILSEEQRTRYAEIVAAETGRAVSGSGRVYRLVDGKPAEVALRTGLTDGNSTEVVSGPLAEGDEVIVGTQLPNAPAAKASSAPRMPF
ncbi:MAG TPA: efflux RND transporter periplasmic adaptor subunit [Casimicrobiaceae bacterium]|nr:efflux RND transporter periplasmic adaptor subunit [Casimicrobiaceae bacterium]